MQRGDGDVRCVGSSLARNPAGGQNTGRHVGDFRRDIEQRKILKHLQPQTRCDRVASACFVNDKL